MSIGIVTQEITRTIRQTDRLTRHNIKSRGEKRGKKKNRSGHFVESESGSEIEKKGGRAKFDGIDKSDKRATVFRGRKKGLLNYNAKIMGNAKKSGKPLNPLFYNLFYFLHNPL